jgi:hypothetical protein
MSESRDNEQQECPLEVIEEVTTTTRRVYGRPGQVPAGVDAQPVVETEQEAPAPVPAEPAPAVADHAVAGDCGCQPSDDDE